MSDPTTPVPTPPPTTAPDLADRILGAPDTLWRRIKAALNLHVDTRKSAVQMATADTNIAARIESILAGEDTMLTRRAKEPSSMLGKAAAPKRSIADRMYGGGVNV